MLEIRLIYIFPYKFPVNHQKPYLYGRNKNHTIADDYDRKDEKDMKTFKTSNLWKRFLCGVLSALLIFGGGRSPTVVDAADTTDLDVTINYTGRQVQTWTAPYSGYYYIEAYGAAGGEDASRGGYGGYVKMYTYLNKGTNLYITCGQKGWTQFGNAAKVSADNPTYNGGGRAGYSTVDSQNNSWFSGIGGGATSIAISNHGELKNFASCKNDVLMVAGGGAGGSGQSSGSGGLVLYAGSGTNYSVINGADTSLLNGQFALGSNPGTNDGGGGGGGWIGGKSGLDAAGNSAGGGYLTHLPDGCTCDLYINGQLEAAGINDIFKKYPYGTTYEFKNFKTGVNLVYANKVQSVYHDKDGNLDNNCQPLKGTVKAYMNSSKYGGLTHVIPIFNTKSVNVTFHRNTSSSDTQTASQKFTYGVTGQSFSDKGWSYTGHTLLGWAYSNNATEAYHTPLNGVLDSWINSHYPKVDLYAVWQANSYKVTYDANGGTNTPATQSFLYNSGEKLSTQAPVRAGYKFVGWRPGTAVYKPGDGIPSGTMNLDLKAMWVVNSYQVAFNGNGNTGGTMENECFSYDEAKALSENKYSKNGYSFKYWDTKADGSGTAYFNKQTVSKLTNGENITASINPMTIFNINGKGMRYDGLEEDNSLTTGIAYKATYTTTGYTSMGFYSFPYGNDANTANNLAGKRIVVTFKAKASVQMQLKSVGLESISTGPISLGTSWNTYYVSGIVPDNWGKVAHAMIFYDPSTTGTVYVGDMSVCIVEPVNLYAQWEPIHYIIKYDANGGTGTMADQSITYEGYTKVRPNTFTKSGYTFGGWHASRIKDGVTQCLYTSTGSNWEWYDEGKQPSGYKLYLYRYDETTGRATTIDGDIVTLHAQWSYNPVSVKVPQILTGDHTGKSQFRVKCDSIVAGNITVQPDSSFNFIQDKLAVRAIVKRKSSGSVIDKNNHYVVYDIITDKPLTAGCWQGSFNIKLTLTKE